MKRTFIRRLTSTIIALSMISVPMPTGTFAVEPDISTPGTSVTNIDTETKSESGGVKTSSPEKITERGGFPDGTGEPAETTAPSETTAPAEASVTSVTEPPAETEVTTATGETTAETTAPSEETSGDVSNTEETSGTEETDETENSDIALLSLEDAEPLEYNGMTFNAWTDTESLPDTVGNWYLTGNVTLLNEWSAPSGETNLCLNGNTIKISSVGLKVGDGARLVIYDKEENAGDIVGYFDTIYCSNGFVEINGGNISSNNSYGINNVGGTVSIKGGNIEGSNHGISNSGGSVTIKNGMVTASNGSAITNSGGSTIITGGIIYGNEQAITNTIGIISKYIGRTDKR